MNEACQHDIGERVCPNCAGPSGGPIPHVEPGRVPPSVLQVRHALERVAQWNLIALLEEASRILHGVDCAYGAGRLYQHVDDIRKLRGRIADVLAAKEAR
jgi:hypothetical protein